MMNHTFLAAADTLDSELLQPFLQGWLPWLYFNSVWWTVLGTAGQLIFASRFIVQWLFSEAKGRVVVPAVFWHLSFWGSCLNFFYCLHLDKLPLILGSFFLPVVYFRNLYLYYRPKAKT
jgi:lipid-A-disaccharide synthase-like uncharacterized protein